MLRYIAAEGMLVIVILMSHYQLHGHRLRICISDLQDKTQKDHACLHKVSPLHKSDDDECCKIGSLIVLSHGDLSMIDLLI